MGLEADEIVFSVQWPPRIRPSSRGIAVKWAYAEHPHNAWHSENLGFFIFLLSLLEKN